MDAAEDWLEVSYGVFELQGYRIVVTKHADGGFHYSAFAPPLSERQHEARLKIRYEIGEHVPQRSEPLGVRRDAAQARALCAQHAQSVGAR